MGLADTCQHLHAAIRAGAELPPHAFHPLVGFEPPGPVPGSTLCDQCVRTAGLPVPARPLEPEEFEWTPEVQGCAVCHLCFKAARGELYVRHLSVELPPGGRGEAFADPTVAQVLEAVDQLDGDTRTLVILTGLDETLGSMNIAGGDAMGRRCGRKCWRVACARRRTIDGAVACGGKSLDEVPLGGGSAIESDVACEGWKLVQTAAVAKAIRSA